MLLKDFHHIPYIYPSKITSLGLHTGHHQTYIQEHDKETDGGPQIGRNLLP